MATRALATFAPAKVNLTLHVLGRRPDGYHEIESLVAFSSAGDRLAFTPGALDLVVRGPMAEAAGSAAENLVLKAAQALAARVTGLKLGRFVLDKRLPVAAGLGGGSADAAAALRLLACVNQLPLDDPRLIDAARATGADVPVCLDPRPRVMRGIGEVLSEALSLPTLPAVLVNPGVALATKDVFAAFDADVPHTRLPSPRGGGSAHAEGVSRGGVDREAKEEHPTPLASLATLPLQGRVGAQAARAALIDGLSRGRNDLEPAAVELQPVIAAALDALRAVPACELARMSGSGATCFGIFRSRRAAHAAAGELRARLAGWWIRATVLG